MRYNISYRMITYTVMRKRVNETVDISYVVAAFCIGMAIMLYLVTFVVQELRLKSPIPQGQVRAQEHATPTPTVKVSPTVVPPSPTLTSEPTRDKDKLVSDIEAYMRTIFGSDYRVARAISHNECSPGNRAYPECVLHTNAEYSVGLFQINLYNASQWIHAGRIPGATMEDKIAWLKDPYNNTLYAHWVYTTSGWNPWSAYTSGNYKKDL